jgi:hypothetical protein
MSEATMSEYIRGFDAGINCVLVEIERLEKIGPITVEQVVRLLDPQKDQKTAPKPEKAASKAIDKGWIGLELKLTPDKWLGNMAFATGAKWAAKQLKEKNNASN